MTDNIKNENVCPYCKQTSLLGDECQCSGARRARKIQDQIERAAEAIDNTFGENCIEAGFLPVPQENIDLMYTAAVQIATHKVHAITITLSSGTRAKLSRGTKGVIKVERSETRKASTEVEE